MNLVLGIIIVGILGFIAVTLRQILKQQFVLQRQIEVLELTSGEGDRKVEREDTTLPADGLPIGSFAPAFSLADSQGRQVSIEKLLEKRKPLILFFASPNCNPCAALLPEIEKWQTEFGEKLDFVFVSSGTAAENSEKFGVGKTILLQKSRETMELYQAKWTPSAVLINADGTIGSRLATGGDNIRELVETIKPDLPSPSSNGHAPKKLFFARNNSKIGKPAPDFTLPDLDGKRVNLQNLRGGKTLLLFWGTNCSFCQRMLDDLRNWENQPENKRKADLIVVSGGEAQINREQNFKSPVLLQEKTETMQLFGATGTPSAVIIDEEGNIASEIAVGADEVFALVGYSPKKD
jgi:peroxiredoxin